MATHTMSSWFTKMVGQSMTLDNLDTLLLHQLQDLYSAEEQIIAALPQMAEAASSSALKSAFRTHLNETQQQKQRLERIFSMLGHEAQSESCEAMEGLISEGQEIMNLDGDPMVKDASAKYGAEKKIEARDCSKES